MKKAMSCMLTVFMLLSFLSIQPPAAYAEANGQASATANLLVNPGFEQTAANSAWTGGIAAADWTRYVFSGTPAFAVDSSVAHTGGKSVKIEAGYTARGTIFQQINSVVKGKTYKISGWMKTENVSNKALVRFQIGRTSGGNVLVNMAEAKGTTDWTYFEQKTTIPDNATTPSWLKIEAFLENSTGKVWFDDFEVQEWNGVQGITLDPAIHSLQIGQTVSLTPELFPVDATNRSVAWTSSNPAVAEVDAAGTVTAKAAGYTVITVRTDEGGFTDTAVVGVGAPDGLNVTPYAGTVQEDGELSGQLIATSQGSGAVTFAAAIEPTHGKLTVLPDGRYLYYPNPDYTGTDEFAFMASGSQGGPRFGIASIQVTPVNDEPKLDLKWSSTGKNTALNDKLQLATDKDGDTIEWQKVTEPQHGALQVNPDGTYNYTPDADFVGYDGFRVAALDGKGGITEGSVQIAVIPGFADLSAQFRSQPEYGQHPRLLADREDFRQARELIVTDPYMKEWYGRLKQEAEPILQTAPLPYASAGANNYAIRDRLLRTGLMYQLSLDNRYAERTIQELEALAGYADWGARTNNILALAELSHAVALAYDWVYEAMTPAERTAIADAIRVKSLNVALDWYRGVFTHNGEFNNINLVDNGNFGLTALAIMDESAQNEAAAAEVLQGMFKKLQQALRHYTPDGAWPEGPAYWHYGGQYLSYMIAGMNNVMGTDYGLSGLAGFEESGAFPYHLLGEGGYFDFFDGGISLAQPESLWFADFFGKPEYAWHIGDLSRRKGVYHPLYLVLYKPGLFDRQPMELDQFYSAIESSSMRSAWDDPEALFASMKGVNETLKSHHDLDAGTFVFDALGVRWAMDSGNENYNLPGFWDYKYQRWTYYRKKTEGHNTIVVNPVQNPVVQQDPLETALRIREESKPRGALGILDMTPVYKNDAVRMRRGMMLTGDRTQLIVQDEMKLKTASELYWFMHTKASIEIIENGRAAILSQGDKRLYAKLIEAPAGAAFSVMDAVALPTSPDPAEQSINFGVRKLTIHMTDVQEGNLAVWLVPLYEGEPLPSTVPAFTPLSAWTIPDGDLAPRPARPVLDSITVDGLPVAGFKPKGTYYEVSVPFDSSSVPVVGASSVHPFTVVQSESVPGTAKVQVRDKDNPNRVNVYTVHFKRLPLIGQPPGMNPYPIAAVEASSVPEAAQGNTPDKTIDGNLDTRWSAPGKQWIRYDLGAVKPVGAVSIAIFNGTTRSAYFDIQASVDGQQWTTVFSGESSGTTVQPEAFLLQGVQARYIRIVGSGNSANNYNSITEVAIYSPPSVTGIELDKSALQFTSIGEQAKLTARVLPDGTANRNVSWTTSDAAVAVVDAHGNVKASGEGMATIRAVTEEGGFSASASVVSDVYGPTINFQLPSVIKQTDTVTLSVYATDSVTGVSSLTVTLDGISKQPTFTLSPLELAAGEHRVLAKAVDGAGHETVREFVLTVETDAGQLIPTLEIGHANGWLKNRGILQSLVVKARRVDAAGDDPRKLEQALKPLENEIRAQHGKGIDAFFADLLLHNISYIRSQFTEQTE